MAEGGTLPVTVHRCAALSRHSTYVSPVASAQVKTARAARGPARASGERVSPSPRSSRDHTERLLPAFGVHVDVDAHRTAAAVEGPALLSRRRRRRAARPVDRPRSSSPRRSWFRAVEVRLPGVSLNATRTGFLSVLERMGRDVDVVRIRRRPATSRVGTIDVRYSPSLHGYDRRPPRRSLPRRRDPDSCVGRLADRRGDTRFEGVGELRVKESDRLAAIVEGLGALGADASAEGDDTGRSRSRRTWRCVARLLGRPPPGDDLGARGTRGERYGHVDQFEAVDVSYPRFAEDLTRLQSSDGESPQRVIRSARLQSPSTEVIARP